MNRIIVWGGWCGLIAGALRVVTAFVPYRAGSAWLETVYAVVDLGMMFALIAVGLAAAEALGRIGLACWAIALAALASIVGPDTVAFGVDFYRLGAGLFAMALGAMSGVLLWRRRLRIAAGLWVASAVLGLLAATGNAAAFVAAGSRAGCRVCRGGAGLARRIAVA